MCTMWTVSLRHAASDTTAVKPAPLMGGRGGSAVDIAVVAPGMSSAVVRRVLGNRNVGRSEELGAVLRLENLNRSKSGTAV